MIKVLIMNKEKNKQPKDKTAKILQIVGGCLQALGLAMFVGGMIFAVVSQEQFMVGFIICVCAMPVLFIGSFVFGAYKKRMGMPSNTTTYTTFNSSFTNNSQPNPSNYNPSDYEKVNNVDSNQEQHVCSKCGHINDAGATFCESCGTCLVKKCSCGATNDADAIYCKKCGKKL
jgi:ribosomal protein L40E